MNRWFIKKKSRLRFKRKHDSMTKLNIWRLLYVQAQAHPENQEGHDHSPCMQFYILFKLYLYFQKKKKNSLPQMNFHLNYKGSSWKCEHEKGDNKQWEDKLDISANAIYEKFQAHLDKHLKFTTENCNQCRKTKLLSLKRMFYLLLTYSCHKKI